MAEVTPLLENVSSKSVSFEFMDKESRFTREVLFYSGLIIEKRQSAQQIRGPSAEFRGGIKCDRRK
jgi:hypothetical protein